MFVLSQNKNTDDIITKGEYILSFGVQSQFVYANNWNDGSAYAVGFDYDGTVIAYFGYEFTIYSDDFIVYTTTIPIKSVKLSGGLKLSDTIDESNSSGTRATNYVKEHIEDFKAKAYEAMPEARKATNIPSVRRDISNDKYQKPETIVH